MEVAKALAEFESLGINIAVNGQKLVIIGSRPLTNEQRAYLRNYKMSILEVLRSSARWSPELAIQGYVWCQNCEFFNGFNCDSNENPFKTVEKQPAAPRKCQWYQLKKCSIGS